MAALAIWKPQFSFTGTEQSVTALPGGGFALAYLGSGGLTYRTFDSSGAAVIVDKVVLAEATRQPTVSVTGDGRPVVFGYDLGHASGALMVLNDAGEAVASSAFSMPNGGQLVDVQPLAGGRFVVAYSAQLAADDPTSINVYIQVCDFNGAAATAPIRVNQPIAGAQLQPSIATLADGGFVVAWRDASLGPQARVFEADGTARTAELNLPEAVNTGNFPPEAAALADGGFVLAWWSAGTAYAQRYDAEGATVGGLITVGASNAALVVFGSPVAVLGLPDGGFVVATTTYGLDDIGRVWLQRYDGDGVALDSPLEVLQSEDGTGRRLVTPSLDLLADGRIVVSASDEDRVLDRVAIVDPRDAAISLTGSNGADEYWGSAFSDTIMGGGGNDVLHGAAGNDRLDGGTGADRMAGGTGNDTYVVDNAGDVIVELAGEGIDTVETSRASYSLGAEVERLVGTRALSQTLIGNGLDNRISGGVTNDVLHGLDGNDQLDGGAGADTMEGGIGDDIFYVDNAGDVAVEAAGEGYDQVRATLTVTLAANIESLVLEGSGNIGGTGNALANVLSGNGGNNALSGAEGADLIKGMGGDDMLNGDAGADQLLGGDGADILDGGADNDRLDGGAGQDSLSGGEGLDILEGGSDNDTLNGGAGADQLFGGDGADILLGGDGNDLLNGGASLDRMEGGLGDDIYVVQEVGDLVIEAAGQGTDIVRASVSHTLADNVEILILEGTGGLAGTGNGLANTLYGNDGDNVLDGAGGADLLRGGLGADVLIGGLGNDILVGEGGADRFVVRQESVFSSLAPGGRTLEVDTVSDFSTAQGDRIDLSTIDAVAATAIDDGFVLVGAFSGVAGQMTLSYAAGTTTLALDTDGDGAADYLMRINGDVRGDSAGWLL